MELWSGGRGELFVFFVIASGAKQSWRVEKIASSSMTPPRNDRHTKKLSHKEKEFCYSSFPEGLELAPSRFRGLPVGHGASAPVLRFSASDRPHVAERHRRIATLLISSVVGE